MVHQGERYKRVQRGNLFTQRVVIVWNELPEVVVEAGTILSFKKAFRQLHGLDGYRGIWAKRGQLGLA